MVNLLQCSSAHMPLTRPLFFSIFLLLTSSMEVAYSDARRLPQRRLLEIDTSKGHEAQIRGEVKGRSMIGSRPPRCERVCISCGHCEAVQVPIVPQDHHKRAARADPEHVVTAAAVSTAMFSYKVNGITNYKPLSWKCRCGDTILDP